MKTQTLLDAKEWFIEQLGNEKPKHRLFCFHNAGGSAGIYYKWRELLPEDISLCLVNMPGRDSVDKLINNYEALLLGVTFGILNSLDLPFSFCAFSGGGIFALDLIRRLQMMSLPLPRHLILNASLAPSSIPELKAAMYDEIKTATGAETLDIFYAKTSYKPTLNFFKEEQKEKAGTILKADLLALFDRHFQAECKINVPITFIDNEDERLKDPTIEIWSKITALKFESFILPGKHFEMIESPEKYVDIVLSTSQ